MAVRYGRGKVKRRDTGTRQRKSIVLFAAEGTNKTETLYFNSFKPEKVQIKFTRGNETDPEKMADVFLNSGVKHVIIKLGRDGCLLKNEKESIRLPGYTIDAVDATGAGDNFLAGLISEILQGRTQAEALRFANACGAICTTAVGAGSALRNREQVLHWIKA